MLLYLTILACFICIVLSIIDDIGGELHHFIYRHDLEVVLGVVTILTCIVLMFETLFICFEYVDIKGKVALWDVRQESLEYKITAPEVKDEFGIINKDILDEIQAWNEDLAYYKTMQKHFWLGPFIPNVYDKYHFIDFTLENRETITSNADL